jgi:hypothetical protein
MALISGHGLSEVMAELHRRNAKLYHACQLKDLRSDLELGGVPSRNLLASNDLPYTPFDTDDGDQRKGVWNLVFFNLSDFGFWFASGKNNLPNPYGPILLCFDPSLIERADDISITLRSAGANDFDREAEGISAEDVPRLFTDSEGSYVRFDEDLRREFGNQKAKSPEMSCSFDAELAVSDYLCYIRVDPYSFDTGHLPQTVRDMLGQYGLSCQVFGRECPGDDTSKYRVLWEAITRSASSGGDVLAIIAEDPLMSTWAEHIRSQDLCYQFRRYAKYLLDGTVSECLS